MGCIESRHRSGFRASFGALLPVHGQKPQLRRQSRFDGVIAAAPPVPTDSRSSARVTTTFKGTLVDSLAWSS